MSDEFHLDPLHLESQPQVHLQHENRLHSSSWSKDNETKYDKLPGALDDGPHEKLQPKQLT